VIAKYVRGRAGHASGAFLRMIYLHAAIVAVQSLTALALALDMLRRRE
jgi:hypothetical protein